MCSVNDDGRGCGDFLYPEITCTKQLQICRSCSNKAVVVLRKKDAYCRQCFLKNETHKFRAALGKTKMMKPHDRVLVAYSGSLSSSALLHFLWTGMFEKHHKKLLFTVYVLFIDEGELFEMNSQERFDLTEQVRENIKTYDFPVYFTTLSECFSKVAHIDSVLRIDPENDVKLLKLIHSIKTVTSKEDFLYMLKRKLIETAAAQLNCTKIFTAEVGNDLAVKVLSNFSLGRGNNACFETGFCDSRNPQCKTLRPLRDFLKKEIVFYNVFNSLKSVTLPSLSTKVHSNVSIQKLTEKFVTDLQMEFPSTVYTIFRTGEKLGDSTNDHQTIEKECLLCGSLLESRIGSDYNAIDSLNYSKALPQRIVTISDSKNQCCDSNLFLQQRNSYHFGLHDSVCYGCMEVVDDLDNVNNLPEDLISSAMQRNHLKEMENKISECLIRDS